MAMERKTKAATESGVYLLIVAGILVAANLLAFTVHRRYDATKNDRFTLSKGSQSSTQAQQHRKNGTQAYSGTPVGS